MEDWERNCWILVETITTEAEQIWQDFSLTVETVVAEISDTITLVVNELDQAITTEIEQFLQEVIEPLMEVEHPDPVRENELGDQDVIDRLFQDLPQLEISDFSLTPKNQSDQTSHSACVGCRHYHGQSYGGNLLVCGMHPYGWDDQACPDWEGYFQ